MYIKNVYDYFYNRKKATGNVSGKNPNYTTKFCSKYKAKQHNFEKFIMYEKRNHVTGMLKIFFAWLMMLNT